MQMYTQAAAAAEEEEEEVRKMERKGWREQKCGKVPRWEIRIMEAEMMVLIKTGMRGGGIRTR